MLLVLFVSRLLHAIHTCAAYDVVQCLGRATSRASSSPSGMSSRIESNGFVVYVYAFAFLGLHTLLCFVVINLRRPDKLLLMGDNIYADIRDFSKMYKMFSKHSIFLPADPDHLRDQYKLLADHPGFQRAVQTLGWENILATYDDHDYGSVKCVYDANAFRRGIASC